MARSRVIWSALLVAAALLTSSSLYAQQQPRGLTRIVVAYPAGGGTDALARVIASKLATKWGSPVIVENRPGASGTIGTEYVAKSPGDGLTLLITDPAPVVILPNFRPGSYNPLVDLAPVALLSRQTPVIVASNRLKVKTIGELLEYARKNPETPYGSLGIGSYFHIATEQLQAQTGIKLLHVPYRGTAPLVTDMISGNVDVAVATMPSVDQLDQDGKLKILAVATESRSPLRPSLPTVSESGIPGYSISVWFGMFAPASTPTPLLDQLHADVMSIVTSPDFANEALNPQFMTAGRETRADFAAVVKADNQRWSKLILDLKIKE